MATAATLYTPEVLALATGLAAFPLDEALPLRGEARSSRCGSSLTLGLELAPDGTIARVGLAAHACAVVIQTEVVGVLTKSTANRSLRVYQPGESETGQIGFLGICHQLFTTVGMRTGKPHGTERAVGRVGDRWVEAIDVVFLIAPAN